MVITLVLGGGLVRRRVSSIELKLYRQQPAPAALPSGASPEEVDRSEWRRV